MPRPAVIGRVPELAELNAVASNVVAYWKFNGDATDEDATGTDLTVTAMETFSNMALCAGVIGGVIGGNQERRAFEATMVDSSLEIDGDITISFLITFMRANNPGNTDSLVVVELANNDEDSTGAPGGGTRYAVGIEDESWVHAFFSDGSSGVDEVDFDQEARVQVGAVTHVTIRRSGTTLECYLNGALAGSGTLTASTGNGTGTDIVVGRHIGTGRNQFAAVSSIVIRNAALTAAEIAEQYKLHLLEGTLEDLSGGTDIDFEGDATEYFDTLTGNRTLTFSNPVQGEVIMLELTQDMSGGHTLTLPMTATIVSGTFSTTGGDVNHVAIMCIDADTPKYIVAIAQEP